MNVATERDAFIKIVDISMIDEIVKWTNLHIGYKKQSVEYERNRDAKETTRTEIMRLFDLLYLLGVKKQNHTHVLEIWTTDGTGMEIVRAVMSYTVSYTHLDVYKRQMLYRVETLISICFTSEKN